MIIHNSEVDVQFPISWYSGFCHVQMKLEESFAKWYSVALITANISDWNIFSLISQKMRTLPFLLWGCLHISEFLRGFKNSLWKGKVQFAYNVAICSFFFVGQCDTRCFLLIFWISWSLLIDLLKWLLFLSMWPLNPLSANPSKWSNTLKQFVGCCQRIVWISLTILWG